MRVQFIIVDIESESQSGKYSDESRLFIDEEFWVYKFPCRLNEGDLLSTDILGKKFERIAKRADPYIPGEPVVHFVSFEIDQNGIYQRVALMMT